VTFLRAQKGEMKSTQRRFSVMILMCSERHPHGWGNWAKFPWCSIALLWRCGPPSLPPSVFSFPFPFGYH